MNNQEAIAVIGIACRFPGDVISPVTFWNMLVNGQRAITTLPKNRWIWPAHIDPAEIHRGIDKGGFLDAIDTFDAAFFNISPREARLMDPQQRLLLESCWHCIENAGYSPTALRNSNTGVFVGVSHCDYADRLRDHASLSSGYLSIGTGLFAIANRLSFCFGFNGPSAVVDTASSSSLAALCQALEALQNSRCEQAIAGGINLLCSPGRSMAYYQAGMLSARGLCSSFDRRADGYVRGEGLGLLFLKPLSKARADRDSVYGIVRAAGINHGGASTSFTVPRAEAQAALIEAVYTRAAIPPGSVSYVEAHGSGTPVGDPIEIEGLKKNTTYFSPRCALGSVKPNIGHLEAAAGIASVIKVLLALKHKFIPATQNYCELNPAINLDGSPFYIATRGEPWNPGAAESEPRFAGVSSFGLGGVNAHALIEEFIAAEEARRLPLPDYPFARQRYWIEEQAPCHSAAKTARSVSDTDTSADRLSVLQRDIRWIMADILQLPAERIDPDREMNELGFNSLAYREFSIRLKDHFGVNITPVVFFENHTLAGLSDYIEREHNPSAGNPNASTAQAPAQRAAAEGSIAIIGMAGEFPGAAGVTGLWDKFAFDENCIDIIPATRKHRDAFFRHPETAAKAPIEKAAFLADVERFDAAFFNISPLEAELMDPQQRRFLQVVWQAFEDAGIAPPALAGTRTGVFVGVMNSDYHDLMTANGIAIDAYTPIGAAHSMLANRASFLFDLHGPSEAVDTACSSSLVAVHRALESLRGGESELALAGGVNLILAPALSVAFAKAGMLSAQARCKTFDNAADGYVRGEGVAALVLKPLARALADGDNIHGLIRASAVNHGGRAASLTAPGAGAQADLLVRAYTRAGVDPATVGYIEAHGTGTPLGDPVEISALQKAFRQLYEQWGRPAPARPHCAIGSVKTRIGHLEAAAGIAGVFNVLLAMKGRRLPGNPNLQQQNEYIDLSGSPFFLLRDSIPWPAREGDAEQQPLRAGVSSFGFGGVNAHLVLEEFPAQAEEILPAAEAGIQAIVLSARTEERLIEQVKNLKNCLLVCRNSSAHSLQRIAYTLQVGRQSMAKRLGFACRSIEDLWEKLESFLSNPRHPGELFFSNFSSVPAAETEAISMELEDIVRACAQSGNCEPLLREWVKGADIPWQQLYAGRRPRKVSLPVYPFAGEPYWIPEPVAAAPPAPALPGAEPGPTGSAGLEQQTLLQLRKLVSEVSKVEESRIRAEAPLHEFGIDSLMIIKLNDRFADIFGSISKTPLFEYSTLSELCGFLVREYPRECQVWTGVETLSDAGFVNRDGGGARRVENSAVLPPVSAVSAGDSRIAIIGLAGKYPRAETLEAFWHNLETGIDCIGEIPAERWDWREHFTPDPDRAQEQGKSYSKWGGFIDGFNEFDSLLFNISRREALSMDPQERLFLQCCWQALESSGYRAEDLKPLRVGVFVGVTKTGFEAWRSNVGLKAGFNPRTSFSSIANRVSYVFDFNGPSLPVDTMCSASLTAIHEACEHLRRGECGAAIAGGVNLYLHPSTYQYLCQMRMLSSDGKNRSFGLGGDGFVPGEGVGAVVLKPLPQARADSDFIHAVILASAVNHGGRTNGYTVPNPNAQRELVCEAVARAGIDVNSIGYIEAHGTGTLLGDPIEITGLTQAFARLGRSTGACAIGSVKSNIGHLEAAAGIAGLTKILLQFRYHKLAPSLHAERLNPNIDFERTPLRVQTEPADWPAGSAPRRAGLSSFGAGGANAHLIVEDYPPRTPLAAATIPLPVLLSAATDAQLRTLARRLADYLRQNPDTALADIACTLALGRQPMLHRLALICNGSAQLLEKLEAVCSADEGATSAGVYRGEAAAEPGAGNPAADDISACARHWVAGGAIDWKQVLRAVPGRRIPLPTYPFARKIIWFVPPGKAGSRTPGIEKPTPVKTDSTNMSKSFEQITLTDLSAFSEPPPAAENPRPVTQAPNLPSDIDRREIENTLQRQLAELLFIEAHEISPQATFISLGLDSIIGVEWVKRIAGEIGITLPATRLYDYPTLEELATFVCTRLPKQKLPEQTLREQTLREQKGADIANPPAPARAKTPTAPPATVAPAVQAKAVAVAERGDIQTRQGRFEKIAVIGMAGRFPGAADIERFWANLAAGVDSVAEVPASRWAVEKFYAKNPRAEGKVYCKWLGALDAIDEFDPLFFNIVPAEAECMDPQQRLFMQEAWRAFESAGYTPEKLENTQCGTYVGIMQNDYWQYLYSRPRYAGQAATATGNSNAIFAARLAYHLNLKGPAIALDTACSSSLVATHLAAQALGNGEIDMALVGGATLYLGIDSYQRMCDAGMLSPSGKCFTFDNRADGFVPGEAVVAVVLKRLGDAEDDNDNILGVILASAINQDGRTNGITAPSVKSQIELQQRLYRSAGIHPETISYVETHGTGTRLGDPIEIEALSTVYRAFTDKKQFCGIGSVKTNLGHTSAAAGLVSLQKVLLAMRHGQLPPSLHFERANEHIDLENSPFYVNRQLKAWAPGNGRPRRAAVSSFGFSGTNAHLIVEEYRPSAVDHQPQTAGAQPVLVPLSARKPDRLQAVAANLRDYLNTCLNPDNTAPAPALTDLASLAYTLQTGRQPMPCRAVFVCESLTELAGLLQKFCAGENAGGNNIVVSEAKNSLPHQNSLYTDEDFQETIKVWITKRKLRLLAQLWADGVDIPWREFYREKTARVLLLPTYPFATDKYWVSGEAQARVAEPAAMPAALPANLLLASPRWVESPLERGHADGQPRDTRVLTLGFDDKANAFFSTALNYPLEALRKPDNGSRAEAAVTVAKQVLGTLKTLLTHRNGNAQQLVVLVAHNVDRCLYAPLVALLKTAQLENSTLCGKLITLPEAFFDPAAQADILKREIIAPPEAVEVRYGAGGRRQTTEWAEIDAGEPSQSLLKEGGVYWISGGLGGLGKLFAARLQGTTLVLSGRSPLSRENNEFIRALQSNGGRVEYVRADSASERGVRETLDHIRRCHGRLDGIVHSAGIIKDAFMVNKADSDFDQVFAPKAHAIELIDAHTRTLPLDFLVCFSSLAAVTGNLGQADYSGANAYLDAFAEWRNGRVRAGERSGITLSINWPLWREGGMRVDEQTERRLQRRTGIEVLSTDTGLAAFVALLRPGAPAQALVVSGDKAAIKAYLSVRDSPVEAAEAVATDESNGRVASAVGEAGQRATIREDLLDLCAEMLKIKREELDTETEFSAYGIDSIQIMHLLNRLETRYDTALDPGAIIDHPSIGQLADYLLEAGVVCGPAPRSFSELATQPGAAWTLPGSSRLHAHTGSGKVAIIAQACRLPQSPTPEHFWRNLAAGKNLVTEVPPGRWDKLTTYSPDRNARDKTYTNHGGFLEDIAGFDAAFFGIDETEALTIDPQQRIILELTQELFDSAGLDRDALDGSNTSVFLGAKENNYLRNHFDAVPPRALKHIIVNSIGNMMAARVSDFYNLTGAAKTIDTACSSSLVAVHDACRAIISGETDMAVAGGIFLLVDAFTHIGFSKAQVLSDDGISYVFDERAKGFVLGEGAGLVLLKEYQAAQRDGDDIVGVILASAVNNDGRTMGLTVPNHEGQKGAIELAIQRSGITPADIGYFEAHGTGTLLGDPIEIKAATEAYRRYTDSTGYCALGSVKSNLGHTMTAAGVTSLIKVLLSLQHTQIPATLHCSRPHPRFRFERSPFFPNTRLRDWKPINGRRIAAISSLGFGGTNCHMIVAEAGNSHE